MFVFVNIAVLVLRRDPVDHVQKAFDDSSQFLYGGGLVALGIVLALITRLTQGPPPEPLDPAALGGD